MEKSTAASQPTTGLEDQLRSMILNNVTISNRPDNQRGFHHGRGRGQQNGRFSGAPAHQRYQAHSQNQEQPSKLSENSATSVGEAESKLAYIKSVDTKVDVGALRNVLSRFGAVDNVTINRQRSNAFVDFATVAGCQSAITNNPHTVNGVQIKVEQRRMRSAHGDSSFRRGRGGAATRHSQPRHYGPTEPPSPANAGNGQSNVPASNNAAVHQVQASMPGQQHQQPGHQRSPTEGIIAHDLGYRQAPKVLQRPPGFSSAPAPTATRPNNYSPRHSNFQPLQRPTYVPENPMIQVQYLDSIAAREVPKVEMTLAELEGNEAFRANLENLFRKIVAEGYSEYVTSIDLVGFGSLASGFATAGSDMDLAIVPIWKNPLSATPQVGKDIPRSLEKIVLEHKMGARLLTRTRVPILKVCQHPHEELYKALYEERQKWDSLSDEEKEKENNPSEAPPQEPVPPPEPLVDIDGQQKGQLMHHENLNEGFSKTDLSIDTLAAKQMAENGEESAKSQKNDTPSASTLGDATNENKKVIKTHRTGPWVREKRLGPLDFPKSGVGIQCDINFENTLGIHNTHLLRCYSLCDPRVRPMVLFIKAWAKRRKINSSYSGTLSSYGWVLMVLHYLVNVAEPPVCPNLQLHWQPKTMNPEEVQQVLENTTINGYAVRFWDNEREIMHAAQSGMLPGAQNSQSVGALLRGFFHYFASPPGAAGKASFHWTSEVLSLRTPGGILYKSDKGWTQARRVTMAGREIQHRYLFAIEDPFELDHNVARTVTHSGIVAIRDDFRRAWRILGAIGRNYTPEGDIFDELVEAPSTPRDVNPQKPEAENTRVKLERLSPGEVQSKKPDSDDNRSQEAENLTTDGSARDQLEKGEKTGKQDRSRQNRIKVDKPSAFEEDFPPL